MEIGTIILSRCIGVWVKPKDPNIHSKKAKAEQEIMEAKLHLLKILYSE